MNWLIRAWYNKNPLLYLFWPFSLLYRLAAFIQRLPYIISLKKINRFPKPVIVVGNITVGGTGKTPLVIALANYLVMQGYKPGIVSRGYKAKASYFPQWVETSSDAEWVGDEPLLIAKRTQCPIVIAPRRSDAVSMLLAHTDCDVVLSDDGLQHYALARDIEIVVMDGQRRLGNQLCLPAGPLRESAQRLNSVDFIVVSNGVAKTGEFSMQFIADKIYNIKDPTQILTITLINNLVHAVAGIGNPQQFFNQLRIMGLRIIEHAYPDHYFYQKQDILFDDDAIVIMTEKDAVKCQHIVDERHWALPINAKLDDNFYLQFMHKLTSLKK